MVKTQDPDLWPVEGAAILYVQRLPFKIFAVKYLEKALKTSLSLKSGNGKQEMLKESQTYQVQFLAMLRLSS